MKIFNNPIPSFFLANRAKQKLTANVQRAPKARELRGRGVGFGEGCQKIFDFFSFQNSAFWYTNSKVLFAIKCREMYVFMVFLAIDSDTGMKTSSFDQSRKLIPIQSVSSNLRRFHSYSRHVL